MPPYNKSAFPHKVDRVQPMPFYAYGQFNSDQTDCNLLVTGYSLTANVATLNVTLKSGPPPVVGSIMGVRAVGNTVFNVDPTIVTAVAIGNNGVGTISYAVTNANISQVTVNGGEVNVKPYETPETLVIGASIPLALTFDSAESDGSRCVSAECSFPTIPTSCTVVLQVADIDVDGRYYTVGTVATVAAGAVTQGGTQFSFVMGRFMRLAVTALTGTGSIVGTLFV